MPRRRLQCTIARKPSLKGTRNTRKASNLRRVAVSNQLPFFVFNGRTVSKDATSEIRLPLVPRNLAMATLGRASRRLGIVLPSPIACGHQSITHILIRVIRYINRAQPFINHLPMQCTMTLVSTYVYCQCVWRISDLCYSFSERKYYDHHACLNRELNTGTSLLHRVRDPMALHT